MRLRGMILRWILNAIALFVTASIIDGITIVGLGSALVASLVWGFVNTIIRPIINLVALPITIVTVGLFTFVINGFLLWLVADVVSGFTVDSLWAGIIGAFVLTIISSILSALVEDK